MESVELNNSEVLSADKNEGVSHVGGKVALETAMRYIEQQENSSAIDILFFKKWRDIGLIDEIKPKKQKKITNYFVKKSNIL